MRKLSQSKLEFEFKEILQIFITLTKNLIIWSLQIREFILSFIVKLKTEFSGIPVFSLCIHKSFLHPELEKLWKKLIFYFFTGKCIHQTERLYNALFKKLNKRGKKDFAIQVFYNSRPGKVNLPNGIYGPHTIGAFSHLQVIWYGFFDREQKFFIN